MLLIGVLHKAVFLFCLFLFNTKAETKSRVSFNEDPGKCDREMTMKLNGTYKIIVDRSGNDRALMCLWNNGKYLWRELDDLPTLGEIFHPAKDCSDIVKRRSNAKSGLYWIKNVSLKKLTKVWCDVTTDGGGFMLVGYKNSPVSWILPSNDEPVFPQGKPHWSSIFGDIPMLQFRIQVSSTNKFEDTKADWLYSFSTPRSLSNLLISGQGGCTSHYPGIGNIEYIKDLRTGDIVTRNFKCSQFGPAYPSDLGWKKMNKCLKKTCEEGFAIFPGTSYRYDNYGTFSFSRVSSKSGVNHNSTAFIGCEHGKCCACFGPEGMPGDFCSPACQGVNNGTVTKTAQAWFWVRSSIPTRQLWTKCMEYNVKTSQRKTETYHIDKDTGISEKGSCSKKGVFNLVDGIVQVADKAALQKVPLIKGLMSYRQDNDKLYVADGQNWEALGEEKQQEDLKKRLIAEQNKITKLEKFSSDLQNSNAQLRRRIQVLENKMNKVYYSSNCQEILSGKPRAVSGVYWIEPLKGSEFQVYCDMVTHGGGWTLVYSYTFTDYNNFKSSSNAVIPRPNWPVSSANVPVSTTPPLNESARGAVDWNVWKEIGNEILIKSNINDWVVCQPRRGSLVVEVNGALSCQNIKNVATKCNGVVPVEISWHVRGPYLSTSSSFPNIFYDFVGSTTGDWPAHDPCGKRKPNHKKGVSNPGGAIFIR